MAARTDPKSRFLQHRSSAVQRGIPFLLTFDEWWALWEPHWHKRGKRAQDMCMCRREDAGAYVVGNVRIATVRENQQERNLEYRTRNAQQRYPRGGQRTVIPDSASEWTYGKRAFDGYSEESLDER